MAVHRILKPMLVAAALIAPAGAALADAIDGDWCFTPENKHMRIAGPKITTPAGTETMGQYSRHAFAYQVPDGDPGAGNAITMQLLNEEEVNVSVNGAAPQMWRRCQVTS